MALQQKNADLYFKILLICGIISSILYITTDILAATVLYPGYDYTSQQVSELSAIGAPTRNLWIAMTFIYDGLVIAFSIGVWISAEKKKYLQVTSILLFIFAIIGILWVLFAPMHQRGTVELDTDIMHIVFAMLQLLVMVFYIGLGSGVRGKLFRVYSVITIVAMLLFGAIASQQINAIAAGDQTPWMGIFERVSVYAPELWILFFAIMILRNKQMIHFSVIPNKRTQNLTKS